MRGIVYRGAQCPPTRTRKPSSVLKFSTRAAQSRRSPWGLHEDFLEAWKGKDPHSKMLMISGSQHAFTLCWHCVYNSFHSVHIALTFVYNTFTLRARKVQKSCENVVKQSIFCVHTNSYKSILQIILFTILLHYAHIHSAIRLHCANTNFRLPWILLQSNSAELYRKSMDTEGPHG